ncbi:hypothetical protein [Arcanobacterium urinimassiliense]|uniref:hypothetical protein n=1 Tax=Arcanobacterium urinimassiliense TaxID=1871014 RepID=UPI0009396948|nr:hypothetical protein [Arcanobacterium urinimassiliense]
MPDNLRSWLKKQWVFIISLLSSVALFGIFMYSIGLHSENPDLTPPEPSAGEIQRQKTALSAHLISEIAKQHPQLSALGAAGEAWEKAWGGVWVPWPEGAPAGYQNPELSLTPAATDIPALQSELLNFANLSIQAGSGHTARQLGISTSAKARYYIALLAKESGNNGETAVDITPGSLKELGKAVSGSEELNRLEALRQQLQNTTAELAFSERENRLQLLDSLNALIDGALANKVTDTRPVMVDPDMKVADLGAALCGELLMLGERSEAPARETAAEILAQILQVFPNDSALPGWQPAN